MSVEEVFDFNIGDEFHYTNTKRPPNSNRITVLAIDSSLNGDTILYTFLNDRYYTTFHQTPTYHLQYHFSMDTTYMGLVKSLNLSIRDYDQHFLNDSAFSVDTCGTDLNSYSYITGTLDPAQYIGEYGRGLGRKYYYEYITDSPSWEYEERMTFYKKGNDSCGIPDNTTIGIYETLIENLVQVYPNPVKELLRIKSTGQFQIQTLRIFDISGNLLLEKLNPSEYEEIDVSKISSHLMLISVESTHGHFKQLIQKIE